MTSWKPVRVILADKTLSVGRASHKEAALAVFCEHGINFGGCPQTLREAELQQRASMNCLSRYLTSNGHDPSDWDVTENNFHETADAWVVDLTVAP